MKQLLVCLIINISLAPAIASIQSKIVNGYAVTIDDFPYVASLQLDGAHICGAAIVAPQLLVTAAHCHSFPVAMYNLRVGSTHYNAGGHYISNITHVQRHPLYDSATADFDVAVIVVGAPLTYTPSVQPVRLPTDGAAVATGEGATVVGWGTTDARDDRRTSAILMSAAQRTISAADCRRYFPSAHDITARMFCAQNFASQQDACAGDSGGPLVARGQLIGIVSWGMGCNDKRYPGVYTLVSAIVDFVHGFM